MSEDNLSLWLALHGLPAHFPLLTARPETDKVYLRDNGQEIIQILDHMQASFRNMVIVPKGQGSSTLLREMIDRTVKASIRIPTLYITIDIEVIENEEDPSEAMNDAIVEGVFYHLVKHNWPEASSGAKRAKLLSFLGFENMFDFRRFRHNADLAKEIPQSIRDIREKIDELYKFLYEELGLSVRLCLDFHHDCSEDHLLDIVRELKWFDENEKSNIVEAAVTETYFVTQEQANQITSAWSIAFQQYHMRPYSIAEIFSMLETNFGLEGHLITIFSDSFVNKVWKEGMPLAEIGENLKSEMNEALQELSRGEIPYHLQPKIGH